METGELTYLDGFGGDDQQNFIVIIEGQHAVIKIYTNTFPLPN